MNVTMRNRSSSPILTSLLFKRYFSPARGVSEAAAGGRHQREKKKKKKKKEEEEEEKRWCRRKKR